MRGRTTSSRSRLGLGGVAPEDLRPLESPRDSAACAKVREAVFRPRVLGPDFAKRRGHFYQAGRRWIAVVTTPPDIEPGLVTLSHDYTLVLDQRFRIVGRVIGGSAAPRSQPE